MNKIKRKKGGLVAQEMDIGLAKRQLKLLLRGTWRLFPFLPFPLRKEDLSYRRERIKRDSQGQKAEKQKP